MHGQWGREDLTDYRQDNDIASFGFRKTLSSLGNRWLGAG